MRIGLKKIYNIKNKDIQDKVKKLLNTMKGVIRVQKLLFVLI